MGEWRGRALLASHQRGRSPRLARLNRHEARFEAASASWFSFPKFRYGTIRAYQHRNIDAFLFFEFFLTTIEDVRT